MYVTAAFGRQSKCVKFTLSRIKNNTMTYFGKIYKRRALT